MNEISSVRSGKADMAPKHEPNGNSRRPGTPGHPGKHLGQMKRAQGMDPGSASLPLFQQQIAAMNDTKVGGAGADKTNVQSAQQNEVVNQQLALDAIRSTNDSISDRSQFISQLNAVGTAFF